MCDGLYLVQLKNDNAYNSLSLTVGIKRSVMNEEYSLLWHRRLGHISIQMIKRLVNEGVLSFLDFSDFETCLDCIKTRGKYMLEIIHTDICCPDMEGSDSRHYITFIDTIHVTCISTCFVRRTKR